MHLTNDMTTPVSTLHLHYIIILKDRIHVDHHCTSPIHHSISLSVLGPSTALIMHHAICGPTGNRILRAIMCENVISLCIFLMFKDFTLHRKKFRFSFKFYQSCCNAIKKTILIVMIMTRISTILLIIV